LVLFPDSGVAGSALAAAGNILAGAIVAAIVRA
jgi:hypothetical protein